MKQVTNKEIEANVKRGVRYLDTFHPGWAERIDLKTLALESVTMCVLGQAFGSFWQALAQFDRPADDAWAGRHGFNVPVDSKSNGVYERLGLAWAPYIAIRQVKAAAEARRG